MSTWQRMPNFDCDPDTGPVQLGNIIADPYKPQKRLTLIAPASASRYPTISTVSEKRTIDRNANASMSTNVVARMIDTLDVSFDAAHSKHESLVLRMESLTTKYYVDEPDLDLVLERVRETRVRAVMRPVGLRQRQPVYLIVGIKIARGFRGIIGSGVSTSGQGSIGGGVSGYVEASAGIGFDKSYARQDTFRSGEDRIIAYTLLKIEEPKLTKAEIKVSDFQPNKASMLSQYDEDSSSEEEDITAVIVGPLEVTGLSNQIKVIVE